MKPLSTDADLITASSSEFCEAAGLPLAEIAQSLRSGVNLEEVADQLAIDNVEQLMEQVGESLGVELFSSEMEVESGALEGFPAKLIHRFEIFPIKKDESQLWLAISNPFDFDAIDSVASAIELEVISVFATSENIHKLKKEHLGVGAETVDGLVALQRDQSGGVEMLEDLDVDGSEDAEQAQQASVVRLVNEILTEAIDARASDIHIEAQEHGIKIRYRIDGVLQRQPTPSEMNQFQAAIISRLKIMAKLNIAEKRVPQDGRISVRIANRPVDVRVSTIPSGSGERVVLRLLDKQAGRLALEQIGMDAATTAEIDRIIHLPHGIFLVTGPTGSGKTTTLYAALTRINDRSRNLMTVEDPIEYYIDGIAQTQVNTRVDMTFARGLRAILRQDPDVVMVGEIRDIETASIAIQASLTGHLVLSTLHTNTAVGALARLRDMGTEPFLLASSLVGVLAQRLVRRLCEHCRQPVAPDQRLADSLDLSLAELEQHQTYTAVGCSECLQMGYRGRRAIYELVTVDESLRRLIHDNASEPVIEQHVRARCPSLFAQGRAQVLAGATSAEELVRVTASG